MNTSEFTIKFMGETYPVNYVKDDKTARGIIDFHMSQKETQLFGIDIETMPLPEYREHVSGGLSPSLSTIRTIQIFDGYRVDVFDLLYIEDHSIFIPFLESKRFIAHFALFELMFFKKLGVTNMDIGCSLLAVKLLYQAIFPTDSGRSLSLENCVSQFLKVSISKENQTSDWSLKTLSQDQLEYAAIDAVATYELGLKVAKGLNKYNLGRIYKLCKAAQHPVADMQLNGVRINTDLHQELLETWEREAIEAKEELCALTGLEEITDHKISAWLLQTLSPDITNNWRKTATGKLSTDAATMADYEFLPMVKPFADYKKKSKLISTYGKGLTDHINPATNRIHPSFIISGARTGRFSSNRPNMQNFPRDKTFRQLFIPADGYKLIGADYSQIELRVAAELSRDPEMLRAYREGIDLHALTASKLANKPIADVTKHERQLAKAVNFGLLFGLGKAKFADYSRRSYGVEVTEEEAENAIQVFRKTYAGYRKWQLQTASDAEQTLLSYTPCGKVRCLESDNYYGASLNTPVQGGAAEVMLYALSYLSSNLPTVKGKLLATVHDEVLIEIPIGFEEVAVGLVEDCMVQGFLSVFPQGITRDLVSAQVGDSWSSIH